MRVDVPTLKCDRCGATTQDLTKMAAYQRIGHAHMSGTETWDLCPECWVAFYLFINKPTSGAF